MSERLAEVGRRIATVRQLDVVVNAMRGIAGARALQSRARLPAIRAYAATVAQAIAETQRLQEMDATASAASRTTRPGLVVFGAEQGFAGAFPEQILDTATKDFAAAQVFMLGSRSVALAQERGIALRWTHAAPSGVGALGETASAIVDALYAYLEEVGSVPVTMLYPMSRPGRPVEIIRRSLLPLDQRSFMSAGARPPPLLNLPPYQLIARLAQEYLFALLCEATAEALAAENEARAATMAAAKTHIDGKLGELEAEERLTRQEEITAEVIELAAGVRLRRLFRLISGPIQKSSSLS